MNSFILLRGAGKFGDFLDRRFWLCAALFLVNIFAWSLAIDVHKKLWLDELYTLNIARQPGPLESIRATIDGCDNSPPLYAMIVQAILPVIHNEALAIRLPASVGYCGMIVCLLAFCRRRLTVIYSWVATLLLANSTWWALTEGRPYSLMLCCGAAALLCWQLAADGVRKVLSLILMAVSLCAMTALHYYSIFFLVPLFAAELVRWRKSGKLDVAALAAMAPVLLVLALHYPLIAAGRRFLVYYWSHASWTNIPDVYENLSFSFLLLPAAAMLVVRILAVPPDKRRAPRGLTLPEWTAFGIFPVMPLFVMILSLFTTHAFVERYALWASIGISVWIAALLYKEARSKLVVGALTLGLLICLIFVREVRGLVKGNPIRLGQTTLDEISSLPAGSQMNSEPIVIFNHGVFLELWYHVPELRARLIFPLAPNLDLKYSSSDTGPLLMEALSHRTNLRIVPYDALLAANRHFILAAGPESYMPWQLIRGGYRVMPLEDTKNPSLYQVDAPAK